MSLFMLGSLIFIFMVCSTSCASRCGTHMDKIIELLWIVVGVPPDAWPSPGSRANTILASPEGRCTHYLPTLSTIQGIWRVIVLLGSFIILNILLWMLVIVPLRSQVTVPALSIPSPMRGSYPTPRCAHPDVWRWR